VIRLPFLVTAVALTCAGSSAPAKQLLQPFVVAHRGAGKLAPENTLAAIRKAIELGVDFVELDVRTTADGELVLMHDRTVDRTTDGSGAVSELTAADIATLDAGSKFAADYAGARVPTLAAALDLCRGKVGVYLDIKDASLARVIEMLRERVIVEQALAYCGPEDAMEIKRVEPRLAIMPGPGSWLRVKGVAEAVARSLRAEYLDSHLLDWTADAVREAHRAGAQVCVDIMGATDNEEGMRRAVDLGADGIQTDRPDILLRLLGRAARKAVNPGSLDRRGRREDEHGDEQQP